MHVAILPQPQHTSVRQLLEVFCNATESSEATGSDVSSIGISNCGVLVRFDCAEQEISNSFSEIIRDETWKNISCASCFAERTVSCSPSEVFCKEMGNNMAAGANLQDSVSKVIEVETVEVIV